MQVRAALTVLTLVLFASATPARAQDDDILAPLTPSAPAKKAKPSPKRKAKPSRAAPKAPDDDLLAPLTVQKGQLLVKLTGAVKGAKLFVDDREIATLPSAAVELPVGDRAVLVKRPGFADFTRNVSVRPGQVSEINVSLEATGGVVQVTSTVSSATVKVDGQSVGTTPMQELVLAPGPHEVVVSREGYADDVNKLQVKAGRDYSITALMRPAPVASDAPVLAELPEPSPQVAQKSSIPLGTQRTVVSQDPWYQRWYTWAGVGAVAVGVVVAVIAVKGTHEMTGRDVCRADQGQDCSGQIGQANAVLSF